MSIMTGSSESAIRLLRALGVPDDAISTDIKIVQGKPVLVICEFYPEESEVGEDGELETIFKQYVLTEMEPEDDAI